MVNEKKKLENYLKQRWECPEGCDISKSTCVHVEALLPQVDTPIRYHSDNGFERLGYTDNIDKIPAEALADDAKFKCPSLFQESLGDVDDYDTFITLLSGDGLKQVEKDILYDRIIRKLTYKEIVDERRLVMKEQTLSKYYKKLIKKMKANRIQ